MPTEWLRDREGVENISKWARNYISVFLLYYELTPELSSIFEGIKNTISESNLFLPDTLKELPVTFESGKYNNSNYDGLNSYRENINSRHNHYKEQINGSMIKLLHIVERQRKLM